MFLIDDVIDKIDERFLNINKIMNEKIQKYNDIIAEYTDDYNSSLHHISVPLIRPSTMLIAIAEMNMPASM